MPRFNQVSGLTEVLDPDLRTPQKIQPTKPHRRTSTTIYEVMEWSAQQSTERSKFSGEYQDGRHAMGHLVVSETINVRITGMVEVQPFPKSGSSNCLLIILDMWSGSPEGLLPQFHKCPGSLHRNVQSDMTKTNETPEKLDQCRKWRIQRFTPHSHTDTCM